MFTRIFDADKQMDAIRALFQKGSADFALSQIDRYIDDLDAKTLTSQGPPFTSQDLHTCESIVKALNELASKSMAQEDFKTAYSMLKRAERCGDSLSCFSDSDADVPAETINDREELASRVRRMQGLTWNNLGCFFRKRKKLLAALQYLGKALDVEKMEEAKPKASSDVATTHLNLCAVLSELDRHKEALNHATAALSLLEEIDEQLRKHNDAHIQTHSPRDRFIGDDDDEEEDNNDHDHKNSNGLSSERLTTQEIDTFVWSLAAAYHNYGVELEFLKRPEEATTAFRKAFEVTVKHFGAYHDKSQQMKQKYMSACKAHLRQTTSSSSLSSSSSSHRSFDRPSETTNHLFSRNGRTGHSKISNHPRRVEDDRLSVHTDGGASTTFDELTPRIEQLIIDRHRYKERDTDRTGNGNGNGNRPSTATGTGGSLSHRGFTHESSHSKSIPIQSQPPSRRRPASASARDVFESKAVAPVSSFSSAMGDRRAYSNHDHHNHHNHHIYKHNNSRRPMSASSRPTTTTIRPFSAVSPSHSTQSLKHELSSSSSSSSAGAVVVAQKTRQISGHLYQLTITDLKQSRKLRIAAYDPSTAEYFTTEIRDVDVRFVVPDADTLLVDGDMKELLLRLMALTYIHTDDEGNKTLRLIGDESIHERPGSESEDVQHQQLNHKLSQDVFATKVAPSRRPVSATHRQEGWTENVLFARTTRPAMELSDSKTYTAEDNHNWTSRRPGSSTGKRPSSSSSASASVSLAEANLRSIYGQHNLNLK
eukprot:GILK01006834.1.p1 GENE.GILK01006834.1~~GILK01006834.1.p1  ORF type:complete len:765 (+),score=141.49 GILK01006834.1:99-2393(+)